MHKPTNAGSVVRVGSVSVLGKLLIKYELLSIKPLVHITSHIVLSISIAVIVYAIDEAYFRGEALRWPV